MDRTIKFRAWNKESNDWASLVNIYVNGAGEIIYLLGGEVEEYVSPDKIILLGYTGLKDKNGTPIFEGDILIDDDTGDGIDYAKVEWFEGGWSAHPWFGAQEFFNDVENYQVIGNIYENGGLV